jgi:hypothetical protein
MTLRIQTVYVAWLLGMSNEGAGLSPLIEDQRLPRYSEVAIRQ